MNLMKTCPICSAKAVKGARTCFECFYRYSDQSIRDVHPSSFLKQNGPLNESNSALSMSVQARR
ncbi:MAG: hypothetical protein FWE46_00505 [Coriobacteriia bacterium]|nr:hypothetical protein [Coriobacteriia bacterium]MCL2536745.1 hypothetical protein [Coriobacteriia bacterium]